MTVTASMIRHRRTRVDSAWGFNVTADDVSIAGSVKVAASQDDMAYERAGWRAEEIVQAIIGELTDLPVAIEYVGLPPHPAAAKADPPPADKFMGSGGTINVSNA